MVTMFHPIFCFYTILSFLYHYLVVSGFAFCGGPGYAKSISSESFLHGTAPPASPFRFEQIKKQLDLDKFAKCKITHYSFSSMKAK